MPAFAPTYTENAAPIQIDATATVTDIDSSNFDTGALTVRFSNGGTADDRLSIRNEGTGANQINLDGREIYYGSTKIGFFQGGIGTDNLVISLNASATPASSGVTNLNTLGNSSLRAGFSNYLGTTNFSSFVLDRTAGYTLSFAARVVDEARESTANKNNDGKDDRAGFSVIVLGSDKKGIELGFWKDRIWAQEDGTTQKNPSLEPDTAPASNFRTFFTQAEGVNFTTNTAAPVNYDLTVLGDTYTLFANSNAILSGKLRDYTAFPNSPLDVYENPNFIFFGDNTPSAKANIDLAKVAAIICNRWINNSRNWSRQTYHSW